MKSIFFIFALISCVNCFAFGVGTKTVTVAKETDTYGNVKKQTIEWEVTEIKNNKYKIKGTENMYDYNGDLVESSVRFNWLDLPIPDGQRFNPKNIEQNCLLMYSQATIETITVPAGTFKTCKVIDYDANGARDTFWFGPVPFERVKQEVKGENNLVVYELMTYVE